MTTDEILNSLAEEQEPHIVVGSNRKITVPDALKKIAVQNDHDVNTITFDCPRYSDGRDMAEMVAYINYRLPDGQLGSYPAENMRIDENDDNIIHFDWTIKREITYAEGNLSILVCIRNADENGVETNHWNSDLCNDLYVSEGLECELFPVDDPRNDILTSVLLRVSNVEEENKKLEELIEVLRSDIENVKIDGALVYKGEVEEADLPTENNVVGDVYKLLKPIAKSYISSSLIYDENVDCYSFSANQYVGLYTTEEYNYMMNSNYGAGFFGPEVSCDVYDNDWKYICTKSMSYMDDCGYWCMGDKGELIEGVNYNIVRSDDVVVMDSELNTHEFLTDAGSYAIYTGGTFDKLYTVETVDEKIGDIETALDGIIAIQDTLIGGDAV